MKFLGKLIVALLALCALLVAADAGYKFLSSNMHRYACSNRFRVGF